MTFKLTYSTMFNPPEEMHERFEAALAEVRSQLGATHALYVDGRDVAATRTYAKHSPIDQRLLLGHFPLGDAADVEKAMAAAKRAFDGWRTTPMKDRLALVRRAAGVSFAIRGNLILLAPPLVITETELGDALAVLDRLIAESDWS